jgi:hypothetical protein
MTAGLLFLLIVQQSGFQGICFGIFARLVGVSVPHVSLVGAYPGNHERDWPATGDRFYPLQKRTDSGMISG